MRVVQRALARAHHERHRAGRVHVHLRLLAVGQEIGGGAMRGVRELAQPMTTRQRHDTTRLRQAVRQRDPGGDVLVRGIESEVRCVLVPGDERVIARLLDPHREVVDEQVRADQVLDGGQHRRVTDEVVEPGEEQMRLGAELSGEPAERPSLRCLEGFEPGAAVARLAGDSASTGQRNPSSW